MRRGEIQCLTGVAGSTIAMELTQSRVMAQRLVMTAQLQQAIQLLELPRMELMQRIRRELEENPLLEEPDELGPEERNREPPEPGEASLDAANQEGATEPEVCPPESNPPKHAEDPIELDWEGYFERYQGSEQSLPSNRGNVDLENLPDAEGAMVRPEELSEHL